MTADTKMLAQNPVDAWTQGYEQAKAQSADEIERLREALRPFAEALKGNWSKQSDNMPMLVGPHREDLRLQLKLEDFRTARAALGGKA